MSVVVSVYPSVAVLPNTVENADVPPLLAVPLTMRSALSLCVVDLVHPVGAAVWTNSMAVPAGRLSFPDALPVRLPVTFPVRLPVNPVLAVIVVPVIAAADAAPMIAPSIAPPLTSMVVNVDVPVDVMLPVTFPVSAPVNPNVAVTVPLKEAEVPFNVPVIAAAPLRGSEFVNAVAMSLISVLYGADSMVVLVTAVEPAGRE